jgi:serine protease SohB
MEKSMQAAVLSEDEFKKLQKEEKKADKAKKKHKPEEPERRKRVFVLSFDGDVRASAVENLREEISAILTLAKRDDEVVLRLESPGGMVHGYGLAASQLQRISQREIPLTVAVDAVAASGGYMMACIGTKIIAAPFAIIGSIGVIAQLPNFNRLLKKHDIDYEMFTAGEYKRTVTMFGENTDKGREKFVEELEDTHTLFKDFVSRHRPQVNIDDVATGEVWYGTRALECQLIDDIQTSDEYLMQAAKECDVYTVEFAFKKTLQEKLGMAAQAVSSKVYDVLMRRANEERYYR